MAFYSTKEIYRLGDNTYGKKSRNNLKRDPLPDHREGDDLAAIVVDSVLDAASSEGFELRDRDVISVTESVVARAQGNYASIDAIAEDVKQSWAERPSALFSQFYPETVFPSA